MRGSLTGAYLHLTPVSSFDIVIHSCPSIPKAMKSRAKTKRARHQLVRVSDSLNESLASFQAEYLKLTGYPISRSWLMREGARRLMLSLRVQMRQAMTGTLHAKPRYPNQNESNQTKPRGKGRFKNS